MYDFLVAGPAADDCRVPSHSMKLDRTLTPGHGGILTYRFFSQKEGL